MTRLFYNLCHFSHNCTFIIYLLSTTYYLLILLTDFLNQDITQQHLCDLTAVGLVEKCVRFHVYCAEVLCDEDPSIFDQKINDENLTKCLQVRYCIENTGIVCDLTFIVISFYIHFLFFVLFCFYVPLYTKIVNDTIYCVVYLLLV